MSDWTPTTLADLCRDGTIQTGPFGSQLHAEDYVSAGIPVVMPMNLINGRINASGIARISEEDAERLSRHRMRPGDVVYSRRGDITRCALITDREAGWLCGTGCLLVRPGAGVSHRWLAYWLSAPWTHEWLIRHSVGATMMNLNTKILSALPVDLPSPAEQARIAQVLGALDNLADTDREMVRALEACVAAEFRRAGFDSVPDGDSIPLSDLIEVNPRIPKPSGNAAYIDMAALPTNSSHIATLERRVASGGARFQNGDALLARITPCLENGKTAFVDVLDEGEIGVGSTEFIVLRDRGEVGSHWPYVMARSPRFREYAIQRMTGTSGRQRCSAESIARYPVVSPNAVALRDFRKLAEEAFRAIHELNAEIANLTRTRDELLPLLMSGKIVVNENLKVA